MTRRLTLAIAATTLLTLVITGVGMMLLTRYEDLRQTEEDLRADAEVLATIFEEVPFVQPGEEPIRNRLDRIRRDLNLSGVGLILVAEDQRPLGDIPDGVAPDDLRNHDFRADPTASGRNGSFVWAAALGQRSGRNAHIVVLAADGGGLLEPALRWFLISAVVSLAIGVLVAIWLGRRLARPVLLASDATSRIAAGDLSARVPVDDTARPGDDLTKLGTSVNSMATALEEAQDAQRHFLMSVSHDLRTPLTSIIGYSEAIADGRTGDVVGAAGVIGTEAARLNRLVDDLLDLAKLDAKSFSLDLEPVDIGRVATEVVVAFEVPATASGVNVRITEADGPEASNGTVHAIADRDRVAQVIGNLVDNAARYARSEVRVQVRRRDQWCVVTVADDGPGLAPAEQSRVFEPFYVGSADRSRGSGLGLAIVQEITDAMGGTVGVTSPATGGSEFEVLLPLASEPPPIGPGD